MKKYINHFVLAIATCSLLISCAEKSDQEKLDEKRSQLLVLQKEIRALEALVDTLPTSENFTKVTVQELEEAMFASFFDVHGVVKTNRNITVVPEMQGQIRAIKVKEGQVVRKGQLLAVLDTELLQSQLKELETSYQLASELFEKQEALRKQNVGTEIQFLEAKNRKEALESSISSVKTQIGKASIKAPISGKIDEIFPNEGEMASPGAMMFRIVNLNDVFVQADVSEVYLGKFRLGEKVEVKFPSLQGESVKGTISYVGSYINPNNRTFSVHVKVPTQSDRYLPNLLSVVHFKDVSLDSVLTVPSNIIHDNGVSNFVYVVNSDNIVRKKKVKLGPSYRNRTVVNEGLVKGEKVVVKGHTLVSDSSKVSIQ